MNDVNLAEVETIGDAAFQKCIKLKRITITKYVTIIGKNAFYGCKKLKTIKIKTEKLTNSNIGKNAFKGIYKKAKFTVPSTKLAEYKKILKKKGLPSKATIKKYKSLLAHGS